MSDAGRRILPFLKFLTFYIFEKTNVLNPCKQFSTSLNIYNYAKLEKYPVIHHQKLCKTLKQQHKSSLRKQIYSLKKMNSTGKTNKIRAACNLVSFHDET